MKRPVPAVIGSFPVFDHYGPSLEDCALFRRGRKHLFDDDRSVGDLALSASMLEPVPDFRRVIDFDGIMRAEGGAANERAGIANPRIGNPASVTSFFQKRVKQFLKLLSAKVTGVGKRKRDVALLG